MRSVSLSVVGVLLLTVGFVGLGCLAQEAEGPESVGFVFGLGDHRIVSEEMVSTGLVTLGSDVIIEGDVTGDVLVVGGKLTVSGTVEEDVIVIGGDVWLLDGASIGENVFAFGGTVHRSPGAEVGGRVRDQTYWEEQASGAWERGGWSFWHFVWGRSWAGVVVSWLSLVIFGYLALHFFRKPVARMVQTSTRRFWITAGIGLAALVVAGPLAALLLVSGVGAILIPLLVAVYVIAGFFGFVAASVFVEEVLARGFRLSVQQGGPVFLAATLIICLVRMIPFFGEILTVVIAILGFGAAVLTRFGAVETRPTVLRVTKHPESTLTDPVD